MPQITIKLERVDRVIQFINNGLPLHVTFRNNQIKVNVQGTVAIYVEGSDVSCSSLVEDQYGSTIRTQKEYQYNNNGVALIRYNF